MLYDRSINAFGLSNYPQVTQDMRFPIKPRGASVQAAYNKILGNTKRGEMIVGYFDSNMKLFAWDNMNAAVTDIGQVADDMLVTEVTHNHGPNHRTEISLMRKAIEGDL